MKYLVVLVLALGLIYLLGCLPIVEIPYSYCVAEYDWTYDRMVEVCGAPEYTTWEQVNLCAVYSNAAVCFGPTRRVLVIRHGRFGGHYFHGSRGGHGGRR